MQLTKTTHMELLTNNLTCNDSSTQSLALCKDDDALLGVMLLCLWLVDFACPVHFSCFSRLHCCRPFEEDGLSYDESDRHVFS